MADADTAARLAALTERARVLAASIARAQAELATVAGEIDRLDALDGMPTAAWLAWQCRLVPAEARRSVTLGRRLAGLPQLREAFAQGRCSEGTAHTLARVATPENESALLATAEHATGAQLQTLVRDLRRVTPAPPGASEAGEQAGWTVDEHGRFRLHAVLSAASGGIVETALRAAHESLRAEADEPGRVSGADALLRVAEGYLAGHADADGVLPERFLTIVHVDATDGVARVAGVGPLDPAAAGEVRCDSWVASVVTRAGQPVTATAPTRCATAAQRRALVVRDRHCRFPGCGATRGLRAHHVVHAAAGGPTRLDNLVLLCARHHRLVHQPGWALHRDPDDGRVTVTTPHGTELDRPPPAPEAVRPPPATSPPPPPEHQPLTGYARDVVISGWLAPAQPSSSSGGRKSQRRSPTRTSVEEIHPPIAWKWSSSIEPSASTDSSNS